MSEFNLGNFDCLFVEDFEEMAAAQLRLKVKIMFVCPRLPDPQFTPQLKKLF